MADGTFTLKLGSISIRTAAPGSWVKYKTDTLVYSAASDADVINILNGSLTPYYVALSENGIPPSGTSTGGTGSLRFNIDTTTIVLVGIGGGTYSFAGLPAGFTVVTATLHVTDNGQGGSSAIKRNFSTILATNPDNGGTKNVNLVAPLDMLSVVNDTYGIDFITVAGWLPAVTASVVSPLNITGTYNLINTDWTLPSGTFKAGDKVTITSVGPLAQGVTGVLIGSTTKVAAQDFLEQTPTQITFYMPEFGNVTGLINIFVIGNGVQFSGSVFLGTLTVSFVDASGIYVLTNLKPTDTLYDRTTPGATVEIAIQDPTIETAFLP